MIPLIAIALVLALATALIVFIASRSRQVQSGEGHINEISRFRDCKNQEATGDPMPQTHLVNERRKVITSDPLRETKTDNLKFWRDEIRQIVERHGSPVKAAIQIESSMNALDFDTLDDRQLEALHKYWLEISDWCGTIRIAPRALDPEGKWSSPSWSRLCNVFGRVNLLVQIAWCQRHDPRVGRKSATS